MRLHKIQRYLVGDTRQLEKSKIILVIGSIGATIGAVILFIFSQPNEIVNPILVTADRSYYESGHPATILVIVNIKPEVYKEGEIVELQIVDGNRTQYALYSASQDRPVVNVTYPLKLGGREVPAGEYWVLGTYRGFDSQTSFQYEGFKPNPVTCQQSTLCTYQLMVGTATYPINFRMVGTIEYIVAATEVKALTIELASATATGLQIAVPREVVDSRAGENNTGADEEFVVFVDEVPMDIEEIPAQAREYNLIMGTSENPEKYRILIIPIPEGTETVEIIGTWPI